MLEWFTEDATVPMVMGTILTIIISGFWVSSGEKVMAKLAILIAFLTFATVLCENLIVTQKEEITDKIYELAMYVQENDSGSIINHISDSKPEIGRRAKHEMKKTQFESCMILGTKSFNSHSDTKAEISFIAIARGRRGGMSGTARREVTLHFEKEKDGWKLVDYEHQDPMHGTQL